MIRPTIRQFFLNLIVLWILSGMIASVSYDSFSSLVTASFVLLLLQKIVLPIVEILWIPVSLISFGVLKGIPTLVMMGLFFWLELGYRVGNITIPSVSIQNFTTPTLHLGMLSSLILFIFLFQTIQRGIHWVLK